MNTGIRRTGLLALIALVTLAAGAYTWPGSAPAAPAEAPADCQFAIRGSNNLSIDVWVDLYDSYVSLDGIGILGRTTQLKIQNHRIRSGGAMDRRFTAPGRCDRKRDWVIMVRTGGPQKMVRVHTEGTSSTSRTVDIGRSSTWGR